MKVDNFLSAGNKNNPKMFYIPKEWGKAIGSVCGLHFEVSGLKQEKLDRL